MELSSAVALSEHQGAVCLREGLSSEQGVCGACLLTWRRLAGTAAAAGRRGRL